MSKRIKSVVSYRSDIGTFEKETVNPYYRFHMKEYDENGKLVSETEYKPSGATELITTYQYNEKQDLLSKSTNYVSEDTMEKLTHVYNEKGEKIRDENYFGDDLFEVVTYAYDAAGNAVSMTRADDEGTELEKEETDYDSENRKTEQRYYSNGELDRTVNYDYDENGWCVMETYMREEDGSIETVEYEYNEAGKRTSTTTRNAAGEITGYVDVEYDERHNPVKFVAETAGYYNSKTVHQLVYDEQDRQIENEFFDVLNSFLMSREKKVYDDEGNLKEEEIFEINPQAGMKKVHYRTQMEYEFYL